MPKKAYRVRNWSDYNKALIKRGSIELWIDKNSLSQWYARSTSKQKRGRPRYFSDTAVSCLLALKYIYGLSLRATQGFAHSVVNLMKVNVEIISYTQLSRRQKTVKLPSLPQSQSNLYLVIDSSGLKVYGEGEWKVRQHGWGRHREWMKLHLGVDESNQLIVSAQLTDNHCSDHKQLNKLLQDHAGRVKKVGLDAGYDYHESYTLIEEVGAQPVISPNINPRHPLKSLDTLRWDKPRDLVRWLQEQMGVSTWKIINNYHRRSLVETAFFRFKQLLGDKLNARCFENQRIEALLKCHLLNKMTKIGILSAL